MFKKMWKCCKNFQKKNVAGAAGLFECCGDVNKRCKCTTFPKTSGEFALLYLCVELIDDRDNLQSFMPFKLCCCSLIMQLWMGFAQHKLGS